MKTKPLVSIITVCYNSEKTITNTIESVINQTYENIEYILVDGKSKDNTIEIIKSYENEALRRGIKYKWISEADKGIFDAMNKGIKMSNGKWINFMNSGDVLYKNSVLTKLNRYFKMEYAIIYGKNYSGETLYEPKNILELKNGETIACHQSMFFNKDILKEELIYDLKYNIYGDYELFNRICKKNYKLHEVNLIIANYEGGGISSVISFEKRKEKYFIVLKEYGVIGLVKAIVNRILKEI